MSAMRMDGTERDRRYLSVHPPAAADTLCLEGDVEEWLIRLVVYTPLDAERRAELDYWRGKGDAEHAAVFRSMLSMLPALPRQYLAKPALERRFPKRSALDSV